MNKKFIFDLYGPIMELSSKREPTRVRSRSIPAATRAVVITVRDTRKRGETPKTTKETFRQRKTSRRRTTKDISHYGIWRRVKERVSEWRER